jgi:uncharacterized protein DUF6932
MIPDFNDDGYLPPGVHQATLDELADRFGRESEVRRVQMESVRWLVDLARRAGAERLIVNGSFVTEIVEPNDVDCVILTGPDFPRDAAAADELAEGLPFIDLELVEGLDFAILVEQFFATDRDGVGKGVVEVVL